jgi:hypothetical protein
MEQATPNRGSSREFAIRAGLGGLDGMESS